jgi:hypothetical protein
MGPASIEGSVSPPVQPQLPVLVYACRVRHTRFQPKYHAFAYQLPWFYLEIDDTLERSGSGRPEAHIGWPYRFVDGDYMPTGQPGGLKARLLQWLAAQPEAKALPLAQIAHVRMLGQLRQWGFVFNPICVYFCLDVHQQLVCAVAEVTNTFWEHKPYLLLPTTAQGARASAPKLFYVSPFSGLQMRFDFSVQSPGEQLRIWVDVRKPQAGLGQRPARWFRATWAGRRLPTATAGMWGWMRLAGRYPLATQFIWMAIHWQAWLLYTRGLTVFRKEERPRWQQGMYPPHRPRSNPAPSATPETKSV